MKFSTRKGILFFYMEIYSNFTPNDTNLEYMQQCSNICNGTFSYIWVSNAQITLKIVTTYVIT